MEAGAGRAGNLGQWAMAQPNEPVLDAGSDSGEAEDGITNDNTPTLNGSAGANEVITIFDGATQVGTANTNGQGTWTFTLPTLSDGDHTFTAVNSLSETSDPLTLTIDTAGPTVDLGAEVLNDLSYRITLTFSEAPVGLTLADLGASGGTLSSLAATGDAKVFTVRFEPTGFGSKSVSLNAGSYTDAATNDGAAGSVSFDVAEYSEPEATFIDGVAVLIEREQTLFGEMETTNFPALSGPLTIPGPFGSVSLPGGLAGSLTAFTLPPLALPGVPGVDSLISTMSGLLEHTLTSMGAALSDVLRAVEGLRSAFAIDLPTLVGPFGTLPTFTPLALTAAANPFSGPSGSLLFGSAPEAPSLLMLDATGMPGGLFGIGGPGYGVVMGDAILTGGEGRQVFFGDGGAQSMVLGGGDDELHGGRGDDTVGSQAGDDRLFGDEGQDRVFGGLDDDFVHGNAGDDSLSGDEGNDIVQGGKGDDHIDGGAGDDLLLGDLGNDTLTGGDGADTFVALAGGGRDVVLDFDATEGDRLRIADGVSYALHQEGADVVVDLSGGGRLVLSGVTLGSLPEGWLVQ